MSHRKEISAPSRSLDGILPVDKPQAWTSHDVVARVRRLSGVRRVGHSGTLDPLATGVLLLCLGRATRVVSYLMDSDKEYLTRVRLGVATDTFDAEGRVVSRSEAIPDDPEIIREAVGRFVGEIDQVPPMFSAIKVSGQKLYDLARRGEEVARAPRKVTIRRILVEAITGPDVDLRILCTKGTYIRSLADDLGRVLGCGAHVVALRRTRVGFFPVEECLTLEQIETACGEKGIAPLLCPVERALGHMPQARLAEPDLRRFCSGAEVPAVEGLPPGEVQVAGRDGVLYGIGRSVRPGVLRARVVLKDPAGPVP